MKIVYQNNCCIFFESSLTGTKVGNKDIKPSKEENALAQLCQFNCHQTYKTNASFHRQSSKREPAFPVYLGLSVYSKYRKESLVNLLFENGLSISYDRVLEITNLVGESVIKTYERNGIVCPLNLKKGTFTSSAIDNIDHNPTAASAKSSFHGTSISLFQHFPSKGTPQEKMVIISEKPKKISNLPEDYTNVKPSSFIKQPSPPEQPVPYLSLSIQPFLNDQFVWLNNICLIQEYHESVKMTWSSYNSFFFFTKRKII